MGPDTVISIRETYSEPTNMFTVCVGQPGCGKSQAFRLAILDPLKEVGKKKYYVLSCKQLICLTCIS